MIKHLEVENYRCFEKLEAHDLRLLNLVVGRNASGKTALLESVFLAAAATPEVLLRMRQWRGLGQPKIRFERNEFAALWHDVFFNHQEERTISVRLEGSPATSGVVRISYAKSGDTITLPITAADANEESIVIVPLRFQGKDCSGKEFDFEVTLSTEGELITSKPQPMNASFFPSAFKVNPEEAAQRFSSLSRKNKQGKIIEPLQKVYPYLQNLSLEINAGVSMVYASIEGVEEKMPIQVISEGAYKLMNILLAMANHAGGFIIVDEIENGFYYKTMPEIWTLLLHFARSYRTQIFTSVHSLECLQAAAEVAKGNEGEFALLRTVKENGKCVVRQFSGKEFSDAVSEDIEIR